jgi:tetratricopeptide (TPR) repeat protein
MYKKIILLLFTMMIAICFAQRVPENSLDRLLEAAKNYYNNGEYERAISELEKALQYLKQLEQSDQVEAYKYLGFSYVAFGNNAKAKVQFKKALRLDPNLELDPATVSPKIIKVFEEAKSEMAVKPPPPPAKKPKKPEAPVKEVSTFGATWRSCCLPGWGQMYKGESSKGKKLMIAAGVTGGLSALSLIMRQSASEDYSNANPGQEMDDAYERYKLWHNVAIYNVALFSIVYVYNLYDVAFKRTRVKYGMIDAKNGPFCSIHGNRMQLGYRIKF